MKSEVAIKQSQVKKTKKANKEAPKLDFSSIPALILYCNLGLILVELHQGSVDSVLNNAFVNYQKLAQATPIMGTTLTKIGCLGEQIATIKIFGFSEEKWQEELTLFFLKNTWTEELASNVIKTHKGIRMKLLDYLIKG
ncbi:MAG: hypothetical protein HWQ38_07975 [Nostoc sp. NMS7]|uniref:hypothetical protein n=1 Tax=Nostoc sp. NMS7 TaxID=2815391 RepID=UPI0025E2B252|nr:hypothetical protein [Nostoc sp. NMS7]MBN3946419.1 hypothetical protein [Nostoc sp. NMS7]